MKKPSDMINSMIKDCEDYEKHLLNEQGKALYRQVESTIGKDRLKERMQAWKKNHGNKDFGKQSLSLQLQQYLIFSGESFDVIPDSELTEKNLEEKFKVFEGRFGKFNEDIHSKKYVIEEIKDQLKKAKTLPANEAKVKMKGLKEYLEGNEKVLEKRRDRTPAATKFWKIIDKIADVIGYYSTAGIKGHKVSQSLHGQFKAYGKATTTKEERRAAKQEKKEQRAREKRDFKL